MLERFCYGLRRRIGLYIFKGVEKCPLSPCDIIELQPPLFSLPQICLSLPLAKYLYTAAP